MRLSIENGAVVLSSENRNNLFLNECHGLFKDEADGKQKMYWLGSESAHCADCATEYNAETLKQILLNAKLYGSGNSARIFGNVEIDSEVLRFNADLQAKAAVIKNRRRAEELQRCEEAESREKWLRLCTNGCGKCVNLAYDIDIPICRQTGQELEERNVPQVIRRIHYCFKPEPFPSERCPFNFNINKNKEKTV